MPFWSQVLLATLAALVVVGGALGLFFRKPLLRLANGWVEAMIERWNGSAAAAAERRSAALKLDASRDRAQAEQAGTIAKAEASSRAAVISARAKRLAALFESDYDLLFWRRLLRRLVRGLIWLAALALAIAAYVVPYHLNTELKPAAGVIVCASEVTSPGTPDASVQVATSQGIFYAGSVVHGNKLYPAARAATDLFKAGNVLALTYHGGMWLLWPGGYTKRWVDEVQSIGTGQCLSPTAPTKQRGGRGP